MNTLLELLKKSNYQTFDIFGNTFVGASDSNKKFEMSRLSEEDINLKRILDIGCNAGYFLFRLSEKNPLLLHGIDVSEKYIEIAKELNREFYKKDCCIFTCCDFNLTNINEKYDYIICFSTFHYFADAQENFFDRIFNTIADNGYAFIEIEEFPENTKPFVKKSVRDQEKKENLFLHYPNRSKVEEWCTSKFQIEDRYPSVYQSGSLYPRYFYKLRKIRPRQE